MKFSQIVFVNILIVVAAEICVEKVILEKRTESGRTYHEMVKKCCGGYSKIEGSDKCEPLCSNCENGICESPESCICINGYRRNDDTKQCELVFDDCKVVCETCVNGHCNSSGVCVCSPGYADSDTKVGICDPVCEPPCENGRCTKPNTCERNPEPPKSSGSSRSEAIGFVFIFVMIYCIFLE